MLFYNIEQEEIWLILRSHPQHPHYCLQQIHFYQHEIPLPLVVVHYFKIQVFCRHHRQLTLQVHCYQELIQAKHRRFFHHHQVY